MANAETLGEALRPRNGIPIDIATGEPMTTPNWATDHLMSRNEIMADPRFARLTPAQREDMLLGIPENYLPMTGSVNSSKGNLVMADFIEARRANQRPIPLETAEALLEADKLARRAVEERFRQYTSQP